MARNPFYPLLLIAGILFLVTACGYAVSVAHGLQPAVGAPALGQEGQAFLKWMDQYGLRTLMLELILLGGTTFGAIATDEFHQRKKRSE